MPDERTSGDVGQLLLTNLALHRLIEVSAAISESCRRLADTLHAGSAERRKILETLNQGRKLRSTAQNARHKATVVRSASEKLKRSVPAVRGKQLSPSDQLPPRKASAGRDVSRREPSDGGVLSITSAHEINNPLDSITSLLYLLEKEESITEAGRHYLELIGAEVARIAEIARVALGRQREGGSAESVELGELIDGVLDLYRWRFESKNISVTREYRFRGRIRVYLRQMREVFANLFLNAIDAMGKSGKLRIRTSEAREWGGGQRNGVRIMVADNGQGIESKHIKSIFEPFFTTKGERGSGIGLSIVQEIVQNHRGMLRVRSSTRNGQSGTVFSIFLPADVFLYQTGLAA